MARTLRSGCLLWRHSAASSFSSNQASQRIYPQYLDVVSPRCRDCALRSFSCSLVALEGAGVASRRGQETCCVVRVVRWSCSTCTVRIAMSPLVLCSTSTGACCCCCCASAPARQLKAVFGAAVRSARTGSWWSKSKTCLSHVVSCRELQSVFSVAKGSSLLQ